MPATAAETRIVLVSAVALVDADGRVLLAQRPAGKAGAHFVYMERTPF